MVFNNESKWMDYSISAWKAAGQLSILDPRLVLNNPIEYDRHYYEYFERRYLSMWLAIYARVNPINGSMLKGEGTAFRESWKRNFCWKTVWKQTLPLLVYGTSLGASNEIIVELASLYCLGQAIPSVTIDRILDDSSNKTFKSDAAFCILSYAKSLHALRAMKLSCNDTLEDTFVKMTEEMYEKMLSEQSRRFKPPPKFISDAIRDYFSQNSRLLSSVFFGIMPIWAYALSNKVLSEYALNSTIAMRTVRQLNDEILDVYDDIRHGLLTLPWLYALEENPNLSEEIEKLWKDTANIKVFSKCQKMFEMTEGRKRAASKSMEILSQSMNSTMDSFSPNNAFDITLLHNIRWALLIWLEKVNYERDIKTIREPGFPQDCILDDNHPIEPIPGAGAIVFDRNNHVLMSLILKRGMLRWELPAGVAKEEESLEETAKRETFEETGQEIKVGKMVALCWHYSRSLNKGWMGLLFRGKPIKYNSTKDFMVITPKAFAYNKFNFHVTPDLYKAIDFEDCNFDELLRLCNSSICSTAHESVVGSGFIDWRKIPIGRIHPLHRKLLENINIHEKHHGIELFISNADEDFALYDVDLKLYYKN